MIKYVGKMYDIGDITYILKEYSDHIPEKVVSDIYLKLLDFVPIEESK